MDDYEEEDIYDDTSGVMADEPISGLNAIRKRFEAQDVPVMGAPGKPAIGNKPKVTSKYGGGAGVGVSSACNGSAGDGSKTANGRVGSGGAGLETKRNSKVNIPDAFRGNKGPPPIDKPKPLVKPSLPTSQKPSNDANNNKASTPAAGKLDLAKNRFERKSSDSGITSDSPKSAKDAVRKTSLSNKDETSGSPASTRGPGQAQKPAISATKPNSPRGGVDVLGIANAMGNIDLKSRLKPVGGRPDVKPAQKPGADDTSTCNGTDTNVEHRTNRISGKRKSIKSVIRKLDGKKYHRVEQSTLNDSSKVPDKPDQLDLDIDLVALIEDFSKAVQNIDETSKKDHGWTEVEEEYDDVGNVVRPISSRVVSLIKDLSEEDELRWSDAGFTGLAENSDNDSPRQPPPPVAEEEYDDVAIKENKEPILTEDELYEPLPDEPFEPDGPPPVGPKPPELPTTPLPKSPPPAHTEPPAPDPKELEKERKRKEKEDLENQRKKEKEIAEQKKKEKELMKMLKIKDLSILETSVGKGKIKATKKGSKKEVAVTAGEVVDIIRMVDNPKGKWLIRIIASQKIGFCDENNIEVDTNTIRNFMKGSDTTNASGGSGDGSEEPQEIYEEVEGGQPEEDEIYEVCN